MHQTLEQGTVVAVCLRPESGVPKYPQPEIAIGTHGVEGDFHSGPINKHKKTGDPEPNTRHVTIVAQEALEAVNDHLQVELGPGSIGENIQVSGLGDLSNLKSGDLLELGENAVVRVTGQNAPCATLNVYHEDIIKSFLGRRGVAATVTKTGALRPGDAVKVVKG